MKNLTLTLTSSEGEQYVIFLGGWRGDLVNRIGQRLPLGQPWARVTVVSLAYAMGAQPVPAAPYSDPDEAAAYYKGHDAGYHDEPMVPTDYPNAYTRGFWEGKR